ncbi:hypothetical protein, conserved [Trypanosoma brucei gambiense DAL972]|uniref:LSM domain-containing protein n=2 Tax=Trypanosoma brucei TaxID=5691 RepID=C9ZVX7_TRYB9|nr:hypothetical protein, conserved [Trypanosoma brucei gambiense DAL972]RHW73186.1 U6 snRNA-associated sm-like protein Lsm2 [Trypanosoma brucei equiperdum]CBH13565.1 hypothetical protein, conserved [Trypanosoma brucei gambiense DAL972]|eukprot:XP_011775842.1 hypothetical protein, conserved [Trypanosoma brucei gambiense DAL972]
MDALTTSTIPSALAAAGCLQHSMVRVGLTNGMVLTGRIVEFDAVTMNMKLDAITDMAVLHSAAGEGCGDSAYETNPAALRCCNSVVVRGCHLRYMDFIDEESDNGRGLQELITAVRVVKPSVPQD